MKVLPRLITWIVLAAVVLALGDAPYVDELFDALAGAEMHGQDVAQSAEKSDKPTTSIDHSSRAIRIYQALASIFTSPPDLALDPTAAVSSYSAAPLHTPPSADRSRIDRPPAISIA